MTSKDTKAIKKFIKLLVKNQATKPDLRTVKVLYFTEKKILIQFLNNSLTITCNYTGDIAQEYYNVFKEVKTQL